MANEYAAKVCCRTGSLLLLLLGSVGLSNYTAYFDMPSYKQRDELKTATLWISPTTPIDESKLFFLFWIYHFEVGPDTIFMLEFAAELTKLGHRVLIESPVDGRVWQELDAKYEFGARVNPHLQKALLGKDTSVWENSTGDRPQIVVLFSDAFSRFLFNLKEHPRIRLVWYFYEPLNWCSRPKDQLAENQIFV